VVPAVVVAVEVVLAATLQVVVVVLAEAILAAHRGSLAVVAGHLDKLARSVARLGWRSWLGGRREWEALGAGEHCYAACI
jgi:hypothetical protein